MQLWATRRKGANRLAGGLSNTQKTLRTDIQTMPLGLRLCPSKRTDAQGSTGDTIWRRAESRGSKSRGSKRTQRRRSAKAEELSPHAIREARGKKSIVNEKTRKSCRGQNCGLWG